MVVVFSITPSPRSEPKPNQDDPTAVTQADRLRAGRVIASCLVTHMRIGPMRAVARMERPHTHQSMG